MSILEKELHSSVQEVLEMFSRGARELFKRKRMNLRLLSKYLSLLHFLMWEHKDKQLRKRRLVKFNFQNDYDFHR